MLNRTFRLGSWNTGPHAAASCVCSCAVQYQSADRRRKQNLTDVKGDAMYPKNAAMMYKPGKVVIFGSQ